MMRTLLVGSIVAIAACNQASKNDQATPAAPAATELAPATSAPPAAAAPTPSSAAPTTATSPEPGAAAAVKAGYSTDGIKPIAEDCKKALAVLSLVTAKIHDDPSFHWRFAEQVFAANPTMFHAKRDAQTGDATGNVTFNEAEQKGTGAYALFAFCETGALCNQVAAAYKTVVPTSKPELYCGDPPSNYTVLPAAPILHWQMTGSQIDLAGSVPDKKDTVGQCVRLAACRAATDFKLDGDPAIDCQKKPSTFKLACAQKPACADVLSCAAE
jgi:hypothetical protein